MLRGTRALARRSRSLQPCQCRRWLSRAPAPKEGVAFDDMGFGLNTKETAMCLNTIARGEKFTVEGNSVVPYGPLMIEPAATVLNYGQSVFEGLKATRADDGSIVCFRPDQNAQRMRDGCDHYVMPSPDTEVFLDAVDKVVRANAQWVPHGSNGSAFYMRPQVFGSGAALGVGPSPEYTFSIFGSPVGAYFKVGAAVSGIRILASTTRARAAPQGVGHLKAAGNYAQVFKAQIDAKAQGFNDVLFLDATKRLHIEEVAAANFFCVVDGVLLTPKLGTILPGITRDSILQLARDEGIEVEETDITLADVARASEAFCAGTAAVVTPVESVTVSNTLEEIVLPSGNDICNRMRKAVTDIQYRRAPDRHGWIRVIDF